MKTKIFISLLLLFANMEIKKNGLTKKERISSKIEIDRLFSEGSSFVVYPLRVIYTENKPSETGKANVSIMINVPKRKFKRAVKRNRLKRLMKESFRLNKHDFIEKTTSQSKYISVAFLYLSHEEKKFDEIEIAMKKALETLTGKVLIQK